MRTMMKISLALSLFLSLASCFHPETKDDIINYSALESPFRIQKINMVWNKARVKLQQGKLEKLYSELKLQDKEELQLKKLKADNMDKDGVREAMVRKQFNGILNHYDLAGRSQNENEPQDEEPAPKAYFKDKRLNKLWDKALKSGLQDEELMTLKQEFQHHQEKVEHYQNLLELRHQMENGKNRENEIRLEDIDIEGPSEKHVNKVGKDIKSDYERLHRLSTNTLPTKEFEEPKVSGLWKLAQEANFNEEELESIRTELHHFETRINKMHYLTHELREADARWNDVVVEDYDKTEGRKIMDKKLKRHVDDIEKMHQDLKVKIAARHSEL